MKAKLVVMFRALKSGELFVEEGTVAVMRLGKSLCYGCCKEEEESSSRLRLWCWHFLRGGNVEVKASKRDVGAILYWRLVVGSDC